MIERLNEFRRIRINTISTGERAAPDLAELMAIPDGTLLGRCEGEPEFRGFLRSVDDLLRNIHGLAPVAE